MPISPLALSTRFGSFFQLKLKESERTVGPNNAAWVRFVDGLGYGDADLETGIIQVADFDDDHFQKSVQQFGVFTAEKVKP